MSAAPAAWEALTAELDLWAAAGRTAYFWWRDDDAVETTPALDRLLNLQGRSGIPLALAIIPARAQDSLVSRLSGRPGIAALQHGLAHENHAIAPEKKSEFPTTRPLSERLSDLRRGQALMRAQFSDRLLPLFVPPWNRLGTDLLPGMTAAGLSAVSGFAPRKTYWAAPGLAWLNTHIDPIDWHGTDNPAAAHRSLAAAAAHLRAMRLGEMSEQALGLLTHHLRHDDTIWEFMTVFLAMTGSHPAVRWLDAQAALSVGQPDTGSAAGTPPVTPAS